MKATFVGNAATKVVHRKGTKGDQCRVTEILPRNREPFATLDAALKAKYRACKICVKR